MEPMKALLKTSLATLFASLVCVCGAAAAEGDPQILVTSGHDGIVEPASNFAFLTKSTPKITISTPGITWRISYTDVDEHTGVGFDGPQGAQARAAFEAVLAYVGTVIRNGGVVDYNLSASQTDGTGSLGRGSSLFISSEGFRKNFLQDHIISGVDPSDTTEFDGFALFDFGFPWNFDFLNPPAACSDSTCPYDFFSVALHEVTHSLGFASFTSSTGSGPSGRKIRSLIDQRLRTGNGNAIFDSNANFIATSSDLLGGAGGVLMDEPGVVQAFGGPLAMHSPNPFVQGSSLSHISATIPDGVMRHSIPRATARRRYLPVEIAVLRALGYDAVAPEPTATPSPSPSLTPTVGPTATPSPSATPVSLESLRGALLGTVESGPDYDLNGDSRVDIADLIINVMQD